MGITIQQASIDDIPFLAQMMLQSSRAGKKDGLFDLLFDAKDDKSVLGMLEKLAQTEAKSHCHYKNFLVAKLDGKSIGTLCSYEPRIATQDSFVAALEEVGCENPLDILDAVFSCRFELNKRTLMFDFMEELEGFVDMGVLKELMKKSLLTARLKGYTIAQTIIEIGSLEAQLFYKKLGFKEVSRRECDLYREKFGRIGLMLLSIEF
jgi:hypothetical protein